MTTLAPHHVWLAIVIGHLVRASLSAARFRQGKWMDIRIE